MDLDGRKVTPAPGYALVTPVRNDDRRIIAPQGVSPESAGDGITIVALGSTRVPTSAGWLNLPYRVGDIIALRPDVQFSQPSSGDYYLVRLHDIVGYWRESEPLQ